MRKRRHEYNHEIPDEAESASGTDRIYNPSKVSAQASHVLLQGLTMAYLAGELGNAPDGTSVPVAKVCDFVIPHVKRIVANDWQERGYAVRIIVACLQALHNGKWIEISGPAATTVGELMQEGITFGSTYLGMTMNEFVGGPFYRMLILAGHSEVTDHALRALHNAQDAE